MWHPNFEYAAYYIICNISDVFPSYVSILENELMDNNEKPPNLVSISYINKINARKLNFAICAQAFYGDYENPQRIVEWIEFHKLMGVEKITFYNESIGPQTSCLLKSYGNFVELLPCQTIYRRDGKHMTEGSQVIALHDCVQRYKGIAKYVVSLDVDEMIVPQPEAGNNYFEMIEFLNRDAISKNLSKDGIAGYSFRHREFMTQEKNFNVSSLTVDANPKAESILRTLHLSSTVWRINVTSNHLDRGKLIIIPHNVIEAAIHVIPESAKNTITFETPENVAYLHHYRDTCRTDNCESYEKILDDSAVRFAKSVAIQVADTLNEKAKLCNISIGN